MKKLSLLVVLFVSIFLLSGCKQKALDLNTSGMEKYNAKDYWGAIQDFNEAIDAASTAGVLTTNPATIYFNRGLAKGLVNDYDGAIHDFNMAIIGNPTDAAAYDARGLIKIYNKRIKDGCIDLRTASDLGNTDSSAIYKKYCK